MASFIYFYLFLTRRWYVSDVERQERKSNAIRDRKKGNDKVSTNKHQELQKEFVIICSSNRISVLNFTSI